jgi:hypothetical protein
VVQAKAGDAPLSDEVAQWKVRAALRAQDWGTVRATIEKMPPALAEQAPVGLLAGPFLQGRRADGRGQQSVQEDRRCSPTSTAISPTRNSERP